MMSFLDDAETWIAVAWLIAFIILLYKAVPVLLGALDLRARQIDAELTEARSLREEAEAILADFARKQKTAAREAHDIVEHAQSDAERLLKDAEVELDALLKRREAQAKERVHRLEDEALSELRAAATEVALAAAAKVLADSIDQSKGAKIIDEMIAGLPTALASSKVGAAAI
jgi:F-type H+-transporting ATPase subunit b